jgi:hypothetical protein
MCGLAGADDGERQLDVGLLRMAFESADRSGDGLIDFTEFALFDIVIQARARAAAAP